MNPERKILTTLSFKGPSFEDHGIELNVLAELIQYKRILIETAKELWRKRHPERERLPKGFEETVRIKFYEICASSAAVPLYHEIEYEDNQMLFDFEAEDELYDAAKLIESGFDSINSEDPLPEEFPKNVVPLFDNFGKTLRKDDYIQSQSSKQDKPANYTQNTRERLTNLVDHDYEDVVDVLGEIRLADLDGLNFAIRMDDGSKVIGKFNQEHEPLIIEALRNHEMCRLHLKGLANFSFKDAVIKKIVRIDQIEIKPIEREELDLATKPLWEVVSEIGAEIKKEDWDRFPSDFSKNVDQYLYGNQKD